MSVPTSRPLLSLPLLASLCFSLVGLCTSLSLCPHLSALSPSLSLAALSLLLTLMLCPLPDPSGPLCERGALLCTLWAASVLACGLGEAAGVPGLGPPSSPGCRAHTGKRRDGVHAIWDRQSHCWAQGWAPYLGLALLWAQPAWGPHPEGSCGRQEHSDLAQPGWMPE